MVASSATTALAFTLSPGQNHDAPEGRHLLEEMPKPFDVKAMSLGMDRAYEDNETRQLAVSLNFVPIVPPKKNRLKPWEYDKELYKRRNEIERLFRRLKAYRRIFTRYDKLDIIFIGFILLALIVETIIR
jgi:transposase